MKEDHAAIEGETNSGVAPARKLDVTMFKVATDASEPSLEAGVE